MKKTKLGFTLVELILYIALISIFITGAILYAWDIIYGGAKSEVQRNVNQNLRIVSKRIIYEIRNASVINLITSNELCLASSDPTRNPTRIYILAGRLHIAWGGGSTNCSGMINDQPLTSNKVLISNLIFTDRSSGSVSTNVEFSFTISSSGARQEWQKSKSYNGSAETRSK
jgi:type II secretory pathway pseudopilin PulG